MTKHTFFCVDGHTCGNPVRLVAGGGPNLQGSTMMEKRAHFLAEYDWIRLTGQQIDPGTGAPGEALAPVLDSSDLKERVYAVRAGETLQLTLTNKPEHKDYFHNTASVTNVGIGGSFTERFEGRVTGRTDEYREVPCDEPGGARTSSVPVEMRAVVDGMHTGAGDKENDPDDRLV